MRAYVRTYDEWNAFNQNIVHNIDISAILSLEHARASFQIAWWETIKIHLSAENSSNVTRFKRCF